MCLHKISFRICNETETRNLRKTVQQNLMKYWKFHSVDLFFGGFTVCCNWKICMREKKCFVCLFVCLWTNYTICSALIHILHFHQIIHIYKFHINIQTNNTFVRLLFCISTTQIASHFSGIPFVNLFVAATTIISS